MYNEGNNPQVGGNLYLDNINPLKTIQAWKIRKKSRDPFTYLRDDRHIKEETTARDGPPNRRETKEEANRETSKDTRSREDGRIFQRFSIAFNGQWRRNRTDNLSRMLWPAFLTLCRTTVIQSADTCEELLWPEKFNFRRHPDALKARHRTESRSLAWSPRTFGVCAIVRVSPRSTYWRHFHENYFNVDADRKSNGDRNRRQGAKPRASFASSMSLLLSSVQLAWMYGSW